MGYVHVIFHGIMPGFAEDHCGKFLHGNMIGSGNTDLMALMKTLLSDMVHSCWSLSPFDVIGTEKSLATPINSQFSFFWFQLDP